MLEFVIVAHAPLASAFQALGSHVYSECAGQVLALDVPPEASVDDVRERLRALIGDNEALVLTDMFGATPCNGARSLADGRRVRVVAGVNLPMLWRTLCYRHLGLEAVVAKALEGGAAGVMHVPPEQAPQVQTPSPAGSHEQVQHHHQQ